MARKKTITPRRIKLFLDTLRRTGRVTEAAKKSELHRSTWYDHAEKDKAFKIQWDDAEAEYLDGIEKEAIDRAVNGVTRKVPYVHRTKNTATTRFYSITEKSDRLIEMVLKNRHPNYNPAKKIELSNPDGSLVPEEQQVNTDNLTTEELEMLVELQRKLHATPEPAGT